MAMLLFKIVKIGVAINISLDWKLSSCYSKITRKPPVRPHNFLGILKEYKFRPPLNFTFNWEDQQGY